jgi:hypothetical protein
MPDKNLDAEKKLRQLGKRVRQGLAKLHPVTDQQMGRVREAVRQRWEQTQKSRAKTQSPEATSTARCEPKHSRGQQQSKSQSHDHGHSQ